MDGSGRHPRETAKDMTEGEHDMIGAATMRASNAANASAMGDSDIMGFGALPRR